MILFGRDSGTTNRLIAANNKRVVHGYSDFDLSMSGANFYVESFWVYFSGSYTANVQFVLYSYVGSQTPGNLLYQSSPVSNPNGLVEFVFNQEIPVTDYYMGIITDADVYVESVYISSGATAYYDVWNADIYADGPSDPFGVRDGSQNYQLRIYATGYFTGNFISISHMYASSVLVYPQATLVSKIHGYAVLDEPMTIKPMITIIT